MEPAQPAEQPVVNIVGDKTALGPLRRDVIPTYVRWMNDFEVTRGLVLQPRPMTREAEEAWYERASREEGNSVHFLIYERATMRPIGNTNLHGIDHAQRTAELGILIGEKECWGKGYGTEATRLTLDYGFNGLGLHSIVLRVYSFNERALRAYLRAGFKEVGRWRQSRRLGGRPYDIIYMDCLATEFESPVMQRLLP